MPVGNQLNYWDGTAWVPHAAATGPQGPVGEQGPPLSVGACAFTGSNGGLPNATHTQLTDFALVPEMSDVEPCLTVSAPTRLRVARPGTLMLSLFVMVGGGVYVPTNTPTSYVEIQRGGANGVLTQLSWTLNWSDANGISDIYPNMSVGQEIEFHLRLMLSAASAPISAKVTAAVTA